ncbi:FAD-dependent oxidoreductase [Nocardioides sp. KIGAM211]|uniref:FAD-dependent oxidoreductase n=1 Tax=Nocardioides luti TaxID=2761101 RepID=A0A7X0RE03_9ACTN|nr:FAD-dependent oxidoreductase [Nocardioides luti]
MDETDVVVVGAGLAGLRCAQVLREQGLRAVVLDAGDAPGGRVRTDVVDGFRCDRGFQLLNPAYPAVRRHVDVDALDLCFFGRGVVVAQDGGLAVVADPTRHPRLLAATLRSGYVRPGELAALARWLVPALGSVERLLAGPDTTLAASLDRARVTGRLRREILEPFLTGVLADDTGATSATFVRLLMRSFVRHTPGIPATGMQALPDQLAAGLDLRLGTRVTAVSRGTAPQVTTSAGEVAARAVVVATDAGGAADLTGEAAPPVRGLQTWWFAADDVPADRATFLRVDGTRGGPVVNTALMTAVAPSYAPPGRHLVQATTLLPSKTGAAATEADVRTHLDRLWGVPTRGWEVVVRHDVERALPALPPPLVVRRPARVDEGVFVAGDHRETASLQGALVSGARAGHAVARALAGVR